MTDMGDTSPRRPLSIVVAVIDGGEGLRRTLAAVCAQMRTADAEVIVPYDEWTKGTGELAREFREMRFHFISESCSGVASPREHRLYDRRRAVGLVLAEGAIVAMTDDRSVPAADWCQQILVAHAQPAAVIGGAIDNGIDRPLHWAMYYCDFGRYGRPRARGPAEYVSDVNVTYRREALDSIRDVWRDGYHETTVHWALRPRGVFFDDRLVVYQHRPNMTLRQAWWERVMIAADFAATRVVAASRLRRVVLAALTPFLPPVLLTRIIRHMRRQRRPLPHLMQIAPIALVLLTGSAIGELIGYVGRGGKFWPRET